MIFSLYKKENSNIAIATVAFYFEVEREKGILLRSFQSLNGIKLKIGNNNGIKE